jgi:hypothetical protein
VALSAADRGPLVRRRPHRRPTQTRTARVVALALAALLVSDAQASGETRLTFRSNQLRALGQDLRARGFDCPQIEAVFFEGEKENRNHMRVVCAGLAAADLSEIRIVATGSGSFRASPWVPEHPGRVSGLAVEGLALRTSLD